MTRRADRPAAGRKGALIAGLVVLAVGGCGGPSAAASRAVSGAARVSTAVTRLSENVTRSWCPEAVAGGGRLLTEAHALGCLRHAWDTWLRELRRDGSDPTRLAR